LCLSAEKLLYYPILKGVKTYNRQHPSGIEYVYGLFEPGFEMPEFIVDMDTQRLKHPGGGVNALRLPACGNRILYQLRQLQGRMDRRIPAYLLDPARNPFGPALFSILLEDAHEFCGRVFIHNILRCHPFSLIHTHIQGGIMLKRKTALGAVELM
jgi:hypothetical protein